MARLFLIILFTLMVGFVVFSTNYTLFTMPPSNEGGSGISLVLKKDGMNFFESSDSICLETQGSSSHFCRVSVFEEILENREIVAKIPYVSPFYELSLLFKEKDKIQKNIPLSDYEEEALELLTGAQQLKAIILFAKVNNYEVYDMDDLKDIIEKEDLSKKIPTFKSEYYNYSFGTLYFKENLSKEICMSLKESYKGKIIYKESEIAKNNFCCYINDFRQIFFYN